MSGSLMTSKETLSRVDNVLCRPNVQNQTAAKTRSRESSSDEEDSAVFHDFEMISKNVLIRLDAGKISQCERRDLTFGAPLHHGSFGDYVAYASFKKENFAIVRILDRKSGQNDGRSMSDIHRKMAIAALMNHEKVAKLYGFFIEEMTCYMLMEPMFASLSEVKKIFHNDIPVKYTPAGLENILGSMIVDLVNALAFMSTLHATVLTPRRILFTREGRVKIGVSSAITTEYSKPVRYSAPELLTGSSTDLKKTGIFSLGINIIEAATGQYPYQGSIDFIIAEMILEGEQPRLGKEFSREMRDFVDACLCKSPYSRASVDRNEENCMQKTPFYMRHSQRSNRFKSVSSMLQCIEAHVHKFRRE